MVDPRRRSARWRARTGKRRTSARPFLAALVALAAAAAPAAARPAGDVQTIVVDPASGGRTFEGIGAVSAGGSSRLLRDYPAREREEILRYLFLPGYGASLQLLKVEIGGDTDTTAGAEPSHMRTPTELNCNRGYEWWLMEQAKRLNPQLELLGLVWGAPKWVGERAGTLWTPSGVSYQLKWLDCARSRGLDVRYVGGWNERDHDGAWYRSMKDGLRRRHPGTKLIAADSYSWTLVDDLLADPPFNDAVDVVGIHHTCGPNHTRLERCDIPQAARKLTQPLWSTEQSALEFNSAGPALARKINRGYLDGGYTATMFWALAASWYENLPLSGRGLLLANHPWSGHYRVGRNVWVLAHTTQFAWPGWRYVDGAGGYLASGGSHVGFRDPATGDYSVVVETTGATAAQPVAISPAGTSSRSTIRVWATDLASDDPDAWFNHVDDISRGERFVAQPDHLYSFTTAGGQGKGAAAPDAGPASQFPLPYRERFEGYGRGQSPKYVSDVNGAFETAPCLRRAGTCLEQVVVGPRVPWVPAGRGAPTTLVGDPRWWGDYRVGVDVNIRRRGGAAELLGRVHSRRGFRASGAAGYRLSLRTDGAWRLYSTGASGRTATLARGRARLRPRRPWHRLELHFAGHRVKALLDGRVLAHRRDTRHLNGSVGVATGGYYRAQFDNLSVTRRTQPPAFIPHSRMRASASSFVHELYVPRDHRPAAAIDDRPSTRWYASAGLPQSLELELDAPADVNLLTYTPRVSHEGTTGAITGYVVSVSTDGATYRDVAAGRWPPDNHTKAVRWPTVRGVRFVRLTATRAVGGIAAAGDIQLGRPRSGG